ncbi:unnamed protein product [Durusdinium trenchii]|uniref:Pseudouridine synthase RsuA/RluA-like domain-containing protein n=1 Tax=Durusdinium trenchii TaxID=1381693 RepID=A0ABP0QMF3_9DINO
MGVLDDIMLDSRLAMQQLQYFARTYQPEAAKGLLQVMRQSILQPDLLHYNAALTAQRRAEHWQSAQVMLCEIYQAAMEPTTRSLNALLGASKLWRRTALLLQAMRSSYSGDACSYSDAMNAYRRGSQWNLAQQIFAEMPQKQVQQNVFHFNEVMCNILQEEKQWVLVLQLYDAMGATGVIGDVTLRNSARRLGNWPLALSLGIEEVVGTTALLKSVGSGTAWSAALNLLALASARRLSDGICFNAAADSCSGIWPMAFHLCQVDAFGLATAACAAEAGEAWRMAWQLEAKAQALGLEIGLFDRPTLPPASQSGNRPSWQQTLQRWQAFQRSNGLDASRWHEALHMRGGNANTLLTVAARAADVEQQWEFALCAFLNSSCAMSGTRLANSVATACARRLQWAEAFRFLGSMPLWRMEPRAAGFNAAISASATSRHWMQSFWMVRRMLSQKLIPDEISFGTLLDSVAEDWRHEAFEVLMSVESSVAPWSPSFLPWAMAKLRLRPAPARLVHAFAAALRGTRCRAADVVALAWAAATLCVYSRPLAQKVATDARQCMADFSNEELRVLAVALQSLNPQLLPEIWAEVARRLETGAWLTSGSDWQDLLGVLGARPLKAREPRAVTFAPGGAEPQVLLDLSDRVVVFKPVGWEVYNDHGHMQLIDFVRAKVGDLMIFRDPSRDMGFLHRLDVPSSGLLLAAKGYEAHADLQLQLHTGQLQREYIVLCHGFLPDMRRLIDARLWDLTPLTEAGLGKAASTRMKVASYVHFPAGALALTVVMIRIDTGRKHQIRSHMAHVGHAILRDGRYSSVATFRADRVLCNGSFLHRHRLRFAAGGEWSPCLRNWKLPCGGCLLDLLDLLDPPRAKARTLAEPSSKGTKTIREYKKN